MANDVNATAANARLTITLDFMLYPPCKTDCVGKGKAACNAQRQTRVLLAVSFFCVSFSP
jgi:hypothetical protein